jgi:hypothetical protein
MRCKPCSAAPPSHELLQMKMPGPRWMALLLCALLSACAQQQPQLGIDELFRQTGFAEAACPAALAVKAYC